MGRVLGVPWEELWRVEDGGCDCTDPAVESGEGGSGGVWVEGACEVVEAGDAAVAEEKEAVLDSEQLGAVLQGIEEDIVLCRYFLC